MRFEYDSLCLFQGDLHFFVDQNRDLVTMDISMPKITSREFIPKGSEK